MRVLRLSLLLLLTTALLPIAGCRTTAPPDEAAVSVPSAGVVPAPAPAAIETPDSPPPTALPTAVAPEADFLYDEREGDLRARFLDGVRTLHGTEMQPASVRTVRGDDIADWLDALAEHNPAAAQVAFDVLGEVLDQRFVTGFVAQDPAPAECAQTTEVLYVAVPSRFQVAGRLVDGLIVRDACEIGFNEMCLACQSGPSSGGAACACTCAIAACPTVECDACAE